MKGDILKMDLNRNAQMDVFDSEKFNKPVHIVGVGATGSWVAIMLAKLGVSEIHCWDFDELENHNLCNQAYMIEQEGAFKVDAIDEMCENMADINVITHNKRVDGQTPLSGIVFILTDTMHSRKDIWEGACKFKPSVDLVIETRMGLDMCRIYNVNPTNMDEVEAYEKTFCSDEVAEVSACGTSKSIVTSAVTTASIAVRQMLNHINKLPLPNEIIYDFAYNNYLTTNWIK
jgi:molybdopterin/thiamine biosynthesis adenylyltransferase